MNKILLIPSAAIAAITPALVCTSCGDNPSPTPDAEKIAGYIFDPTDLDEKPLEGDWATTVMAWTNDQWTAEVYYDLFGWFNWPNLYGIGNAVTFKNLYENNTVGIKTNIGRCVVNVDQTKNTISIDFLGYVSFVFIQDYKDEWGEVAFKKDDYVMLTFELKNFSIEPIGPINGEVGFKYAYDEHNLLPYCLGFFKVKKVDQEFLNYIEQTDTIEWEGVPANSQNYIKQA